MTTRPNRGAAEWSCVVAGCDTPAHERSICHKCAGQLTRQIAELPWLLNQLHITLARQARIGAFTNGSRSADKPLPYDHRASEATSVLHSTLMGWVREMHDGIEYRPVPSPEAMSLWLHARTPRLLDHPKAHEAVDEIGFATNLAKRVIDRPANRTTFTVGPCPEPDPTGDGNWCNGKIRTYIPTAEDRPCRMECEQCGATWYTWQWLHAGKRILDRIETMSA